MAHASQRDFFQSVREMFPEMFEGRRVLDVGSLDVNGNNRFLFQDCEYIGLDLGPGPNVDVVCIAHEYDAPPFHVICSSSAFEHDMHIAMTMANIVRLLLPGGLFFFTCSGDEGEHGTSSVEPWASPFTSATDGWRDYYRELHPQDIEEMLDLPSIFSDYYLKEEGRDLKFWGVKDEASV